MDSGDNRRDNGSIAMCVAARVVVVLEKACLPRNSNSIRPKSFHFQMDSHCLS